MAVLYCRKNIVPQKRSSLKSQKWQQRCTRLSQTRPQNGSGALVEADGESEGRLSAQRAVNHRAASSSLSCLLYNLASRDGASLLPSPPPLLPSTPLLLPLAPPTPGIFFCLLFPPLPRYAFSAPAPRLPAGCTVLRVDVSCGDDGACKRLKL